MSQSPFSPDRGRSKAKRRVFPVVVVLMIVTGLVLFLSSGGGDGSGTPEPASGEAGEQADGQASRSSGGGGSSEEEQTREEKARKVSERFIQAVYGYSGDSEEEYRQGVMDYSQSYDLLSSPGGVEIQSYAELAGEGRLPGTARLTAFEIGQASGEEITANVEFVVGEATDGRITDESVAYGQRWSLRPHQDTYKVNYATAPEPV